MADFIKQIFCANCQQVTTHKGSLDVNNGEFIFECQNVITPAVVDPTTNQETSPAVICDRFLKFPADTTVEDFPTLLQKHQEANQGQVSLEGQEVKLQEFIDAPSAPVDTQPADAAPVDNATPTQDNSEIPH